MVFVKGEGAAARKSFDYLHMCTTYRAHRIEYT